MIPIEKPHSVVICQTLQFLNISFMQEMEVAWTNVPAMQIVYSYISSPEVDKLNHFLPLQPEHEHSI